MFQKVKGETQKQVKKLQANKHNTIEPSFKTTKKHK